VFEPPGTGAPFAPPPPSTLVGAGFKEMEDEDGAEVDEFEFEDEFEDEDELDGAAEALVRVTVDKIVAMEVVV